MFITPNISASTTLIDSKRQFNKAQSKMNYPAANNPFHLSQNSGGSSIGAQSPNLSPNNPFFSAQQPLHEQSEHVVVPPPPSEPHPDDIAKAKSVPMSNHHQKCLILIQFMSNVMIQSTCRDALVCQHNPSGARSVSGDYSSGSNGGSSGWEAPVPSPRHLSSL